MDAFMLYIDDWLSSQAIFMMDAAEERGYLRLLMNAAKSEDCGIPDNDVALANLSMLNQQWFRPTAEKSKRTGETSGEKLRRNFQSRDGRLYNARLLKEWTRQKEYQESRGGAAKIAIDARWSLPNVFVTNSETNGVGISSRIQTKVGVKFEVLTERLERIPELSNDELWECYWAIFVFSGKALSDSDKRKALQAWLSVGRSEQELALEDAYKRATDGSWPDGRRTQFPHNHIAEKPWNRVACQRIMPEAKRLNQKDEMLRNA